MPRSSGGRTSKRKISLISTAESNNAAATHEKWLTDEDRQEIRETFLAFANPNSDKSQESALTVKQARKALATINISLSRDEIQSWVSGEKDGDGILDWSTFSKLATTYAIQRSKSSLAFSLIDQDRKGVIVIEDLRRIADELGEEITDEELQEMFDEVDQAGEGLIYLDDFFAVARRVRL